MRRTLLITTALAAVAGAAQAQTVGSGTIDGLQYQTRISPDGSSAATIPAAAEVGVAKQIFPGSGTIIDAQGHVWEITPSGSITKDGNYVPGGGGTAALTIGPGGVVYGKDSGHGPVNPGGWFALSSDGQSWIVSSVQRDATPVTTAALTSTSATPAIQAPVVCGSGVGSNAFKMVNGRIIGPDDKDWIARGINVADNDLGAADQMIQMFPGLNFVRLAIYKYQDPGAYAGFINTMTGRGTVVEIEHHVETNGATGGGGQGDIASGAWLAAENAFYASVAAAYKNNPYVWFGTTNEPPNAAGLSQWQQATYQAIRGTGNTNPILLEIMGWPGAWNNAMDPSVYAQMTNVIWDTHFYGWTSRKSQDQNVVDQALADEIKQVQQIKSADGVMPAIIAEWGTSTDGRTLDENYNQVIEAVINSGGAGKFGSAVWHWGMQDCCNNLNSGSSLTDLGQRAALYIGTSVQPCTAAEAATNAQNLVTGVTAQLTAADAQLNPGTPAPMTPAPASPDVTDPAIAALNQSAEASIAQANAIITGTQQRMQANVATSP